MNKIGATTSVVAFFVLMCMEDKLVDTINYFQSIILSQEGQKLFDTFENGSGRIIDGQLILFKLNNKQLAIINVGDNWVSINSTKACVIPFHFFNRYRKRFLTRHSLTPERNIRCSKEDRITEVIETLLNLNLYFAIPEPSDPNDNILSNYNQPLYWCEFGIIPVTMISNSIARCETFISYEMLTDKQRYVWNYLNDAIKSSNSSNS